MSKLYQKYTNLKKQNSENLYLFKSGIFYIFLDEDAKKMSPILSLKLTNLNEKILKCGFPVSKLDKYLTMLNALPYKINIIDEIEATPSPASTYFNKQSLENFVMEICNVNLDNLSVREAFDLLTNLKDYASKLAKEMNLNGAK